MKKEFRGYFPYNIFDKIKSVYIFTSSVIYALSAGYYIKGTGENYDKRKYNYDRFKNPGY